MASSALLENEVHLRITILPESHGSSLCQIQIDIAKFLAIQCQHAAKKFSESELGENCRSGMD